jgi:hypothetical protein
MGNSKKGSTVEEKFVFTGVQLDFEQFRTVMHTHFEDKDQQWFPNDCKDLPQHCRGKDRKKCYNTNTDRPQQVFNKEDRKWQ